MTPVGLIGILLSLAALPFAFVRPSPQRYLLFFLLLGAHVSTAIIYHQYVQTTSADTSLYYFDRYGLRHWEFAFGTSFTVQLVQWLKGLLGGSYLDFFLLFQAFGLWGIVAIMRIFEEIHLELGMRPTPVSYALLFLPGMHFWTSAIGKDAPVFLGMSLAMWASMRLPRRVLVFGAGVVVMMAFRPHIAGLIVASVAGAALFDRHGKPLTRAALVIAAIAGLVLLLSTIEQAINVDFSSAESFGQFVERQQDISKTIGGGTAMTDASYPVRLFSSLFRPFFFDANGVFAIVASFESLLFLGVFLFLLRGWRSVLHVSRRVFFHRVAAIFSLLMALLLGLVFYNVGLAARQKMMIVPTLFTLFVVQWALHAQRKQVFANERREPGPGSAAGATSAISTTATVRR